MKCFFLCDEDLHYTWFAKRRLTLEITKCPPVPAPYEATWLQAYTLLSWPSRNKAISFIYWPINVSLIKPYINSSIHLSIHYSFKPWISSSFTFVKNNIGTENKRSKHLQSRYLSASSNGLNIEFVGVILTCTITDCRDFFIFLGIYAPDGVLRIRQTSDSSWEFLKVEN